jgi:iron complex outermembrane receptor protein
MRDAHSGSNETAGRAARRRSFSRIAAVVTILPAALGRRVLASIPAAAPPHALASISVALLAAIASAGVVAAEDARTFELDPLVVEKARLGDDRTRSTDEARREIERTPGGVALVPEEEIRESRAANLQDVLEFVPGVLVRSRFGADESQISIRGSGLRNNFHLRGLNVLIDGFPYGFADGFSDFESLELLTAKRVEVYKGANALRFGANSLGGAINLVTKTGADADAVEVRSEGGSFGYYKGYVATGQVHGPYDLYAAFADTELDGFRDHSQQTRRRFYTSLGHITEGGTTTRLDLSYTRNEEELPGALTLEEFKDDPTQADPAFRAARAGRDYDYGRGALTVRTPLGAGQALEGNVQLQMQDLEHPLSFAILTGDTWSWSTEGRWILARPLWSLPSRLTVGLQYAGTRQEDVRFENEAGEDGARSRDQTNEAHNVGLYAEEQLDVTDRLALVLGGRLQWSYRATDDDLGDGGSDSTDFFAFSPKIGAIWALASGAELFANASQASEPPLLLELTSPEQIGGDLSELDAQDSWQFEIGTRGRWDEHLAWDVAVYDIELWDEIRNVNVPPFPGAPFTIPRFTNIDRSRHTGVEVGLDARLVDDLGGLLGAGEMNDVLRFRIAYTWSRFVFVDDDEFGDNFLPGAPEHFVVAELRYEHPLGLWIAPGMEAVPAAYYVDSANTAETESYALLDLRLGWDHAPSRLGVFFEARNLLDMDYISSVVVDSAIGRFFEPGAGRAFYGGVSWRWG